MSLPIQSDGVGLLFAREAAGTPGVQPTSGFIQLQPNPGGIQGFTRQNQIVERHILSKNLTPERGEVVGYDVSPKIAHDLTIDLLNAFCELVFRSAAVHAGNKGQSLYRPTAVTSTGYTVPALGDLTAGLLVFASGFATAANNGLKVVASSSTGTEIKAAGLVAEASPPANVVVRVAGVQGATDDIEMDASGNLTSTLLDFTAQGLAVGQRIYIGDPTSGAAFAFANTAYTGSAVIQAIAANKLTLKLRTWIVGSADLGTGKTIRILFTKFLRNVPLDGTGVNGYLNAPTATLEVSEPGAESGGATSYTYVSGCGVDTFELDMPVESKVTATIGMVGMVVNAPTTVQATGSSAAYSPLLSQIFSTAGKMLDIRLLKQSDESTLSAEVNACKVSIKNNIKPRKQLATSGAAGLVYGEYNPSLTLDVYVLSNDLTRAVDASTDCTFDCMLKNGDGGFALDFPMVKINKGDKTYAAGTSVMLSADLPAARDPSTGLLHSLSMFAYLP